MKYYVNDKACYEDIFEEWLQILRNEDFISWQLMKEASSKAAKGKIDEAKEEVENIIRIDSVDKYEKAKKLYSYIRDNYIKGNINLSYKEILS